MNWKQRFLLGVAMEIALGFLSCGMLIADVPEVPQGILTADQIHIAGSTGIFVGMFVAMVLYLLILIVVVFQIFAEVRDLRVLLGRLVRAAGLGGANL
jgi:hypothetical protein